MLKFSLSEHYNNLKICINFKKQKHISDIIKYFNNHEKLFLFLIIFIVYTINFRSIPASDTIPASFLPFSILENHNLYMDRYSAIFIQESTPSFFVEIKGHYLSLFPIVTPLLVTPLYIITYTLLKLINYPIDVFNPGFLLIVTIMEKLSASIIATLSSIFVFSSLKELTNRRIALIGAIIFAFATNTWTISSQALWQHGMSELLLSMIIYFVIINEKKEENKNISYLGLLSGLFIYNRPPDSILLLPVLIYILSINKFKIIRYFSFMFAASTPFLLYNFYFFGNLFGGYNSNFDVLALNSETWLHFIGLLISPNRGLFVYSPILVLAIFGYFKISKIVNKRIKSFLFIFGLSIILNILVYSSFWHWWGGWSYGPRFLTGMLPILIIFSGLYLDNHINYNNKKKMISISIGLILISWSIFVQIVGAFYYPNGGWDDNPNLIQHPERLWDWKDTQIMRTFNDGMIGTRNPLKDLYFIWETRKYKNIINNGNITKGWYALERWSDTQIWMKNNGTINIYSNINKTIFLNFKAMSFYKPRVLQVYLNNELVSQMNFSSQEVVIKLNSKEGENKIRFYAPSGCQRPADIPELDNKDQRCLSFLFQDITII